MLKTLIARLIPFAGWLKIGAVALCLVGVGVWHVRALIDARAAGFKAAQVACEKAASAAEAEAAERLTRQRSRADKAVADFVASSAEFEKQIRTRQNALRKATVDLASCKLGADVVRLLNDSRASATGGHRPAEPGAVPPVSGP